MTVALVPGPGGSAWTSTRFTATVNGNAAHVYGRAHTSGVACAVWNLGESIEVSWLQYGRNETTTVEITRLAGAITSAKVYPQLTGVTAVITAGKLVLTIPAVLTAGAARADYFRLELNGDRKHAMHVFAKGLPSGPPDVYDDWTVVGMRAISGVDAGTDLYTTAAAHGFASQERVRVYSTGTYPAVTGAALTEDEFYYVVSDTATTFGLSRTPGGAAIDITSVAGIGALTVYRTTWTGGDLYFPPGFSRIGRLFSTVTGLDYYLAPGAVVTGSFDVRARESVRMAGPGVLDGGFAVRATVAALPFEQQVLYAMFAGYDGVDYTTTNTVSDMTVVRQPWYLSHEGVNDWHQVSVISPWEYNADGFECSEGPDNAASVRECFAFVGDDGAKVDSSWFSMHVTDSFLVVTNGGPVLFGYFAGAEEAGVQQTLEDCHFLSLAKADNSDTPGQGPAIGANAIFKAWIDSHDYQPLRGRFGLRVTNCSVWGPMVSRLFSMGNRLYPFGGARNGYGQLRDVVFDGLTVEQAPAQISLLLGLDRKNAPHDLAFNNITIAGVPITARNWLTYVTHSAFAHRVWVDGVPVVTQLDICNRALARVGDTARVSSIAPVDGSVQATLCAQFYQAALDSVLERHEWGFARTRVELELVDEDEPTDIDAFDYRYQIPAGMLKPIAILPAGSANDYTPDPPIEFEKETDQNGDLVIYTDEPNAWLRFTRHISDPNLLTPLARDAVECELAARIVGPLMKGDVGAAMSLRFKQMAEALLAQARIADAQARRATPLAVPAWMAPRGVTRMLPRRAPEA